MGIEEETVVRNPVAPSRAHSTSDDNLNEMSTEKRSLLVANISPLGPLQALELVGNSYPAL